MKLVNEYTYCTDDTHVTISTYHLTRTGADMYDNIDFLYNCKANPSGYECTKDWLEYEFNASSIDEAIKTTSTKEYQFLYDNDFYDECMEFGKCIRHKATFINRDIVVVETTMYYDI